MFRPVIFILTLSLLSACGSSGEETPTNMDEIPIFVGTWDIEISIPQFGGVRTERLPTIFLSADGSGYSYRYANTQNCYYKSIVSIEVEPDENGFRLICYGEGDNASCPIAVGDEWFENEENASTLLDSDFEAILCDD